MQEDYKPQHRKAFETLQRTTSIVMALFFIAVGVMCVLAERYHIERLLQYDNVFRYLFAFICFLYGGFRLYRGFKKDY